ncbi:hypothetical protein CcaCcLH18_08687 [Colletotrichum camelliae]|nr:hypothetical protein CcaCcLH18_08687 [Colletotrichum camelliae]
MLDTQHTRIPNMQPSSDTNAYTLGSIGKHNIVIACLPKGRLGTVSAANVATHMITTFPSIKIGLMVGIGGGIPSNKVRLGDVVVSTPTGRHPGVVQWDIGKTKEGGMFERTGSLNNPPTFLLTALTRIESDHEMGDSKISEHLDDINRKFPKMAPKYLRSEFLRDVIFEADSKHINSVNSDEEDEYDPCSSCNKAHAIEKKPEEARIHYGLVASGNQVIKDGMFRDKLNEALGGNVLCVEMEAAGLMTNFPCLVIRGICDYADSHKNKKWQEHAAAVAAAFAKEFLAYVDADMVHAEPSVHRVLRDISGIIMRTTSKLDNLGYSLDRQSELKVLEWVTPFDYGPQQSDTFQRQHPVIENTLTGCLRQDIRAEEYDVCMFVDSQLPKALRLVPETPGLQEDIRDNIIRLVDGMFLLAELYLDSLRDKTSIKEVRQTLDEFENYRSKQNDGDGQHTLKKAYGQAVERIRNQSYHLRTLAWDTLGWIIHANRPMTANELQHALAVTKGDQMLNAENIRRLDVILSVCAGLVKVDKRSNIVRLVHLTAHEYLSASQGALFPNHQANMTTVCLTYLTFHGLDSILSYNEAPKLELGRLPFMSYAAENWGHHARKSSVLDESTLEFLSNRINVSFACGYSKPMMCTHNVMEPDETWTGLHAAAHFGLLEALEILVQRGYAVDSATSQYGITPLMVASRKGFEDCVEPASHGQAVIVKELLDNGADLNNAAWAQISHLWESGMTCNCHRKSRIITGTTAFYAYTEGIFK